MGEKDPLAQHTLVPSSELDLGYGKGMPEVQAAVHVGKGKVAEPLGVLLQDLLLGQPRDLLRRRSVDLESLFGLPSILVLFLETLEVVSLGRLEDVKVGM